MTPPPPTENTSNTPTIDQSPAPSHSELYKTTVDGAGGPVELRLYFFEPPGHRATDARAAILFFFGGGWRNGSPEKFYPHCAYLASRGMVAVAADYRVEMRAQTTPFECVADGKSAMRYLRANAARFGIDANRIAAAGSSAGGHVAASCGILPGLDDANDDRTVSPRPDAMVLYNPVIDTSTAGYGYDQVGERWREISPHHHVHAGLPPTLVVHPVEDKTVPYANATAFVAAMHAAGNRCDLISPTGIGHGFVYNFTSPAARQAIYDTDVFLTSLDYVTGEPTLVVGME